MNTVHPLSHAQEAQWFLQELSPDSGAYNAGLAVRVNSAVDVAALAQAVAALGPRHGMLRSRFTLAEGLPARLESSTSPLRLTVREHPGVTAERLHAAVRAELTAPFALRADVPFRIALLTNGPEDAVLLVAGHHIATDAVSNTLLLRDLLQEYGRITGAPHTAPRPLPAGYDDHVDKERRLLASARGTGMARYWQGVHRGSAPAALPTDRPRPPVQSFTGETLRVTAGPELTDAVADLAAATGATRYAALLGVFQAVLHRHTRQRDFLVGVPTTTRLSSRMRDVVGNFMNTVVVRARPQPRSTFRAYVLAADEQLKHGMEAARYPFSLIARAAGTQRAAGRSPLYQITFNLLATAHFDAALQPVLDTTRPERLTHHAGLVLSPYHLPQQEGQLDLAVDVLQGGDALAFDFRYDTHLYERESVQWLSGHFLRAIDIAARNPDSIVAAARFWDAATPQSPGPGAAAPRNDAAAVHA
ncbi:condensation domain-containing protein [Kitasatospora sp. NPDC058170]|uniref:condensation domain-containing protein n=1 Tax=Kitasatospora sp. NPDC058170 TaxID=3346364 RepID=UPI0036DD7909